MQIVTAANDNKDYPELVKQCVSSAEALGYDISVYDLGGLGYGNNTFAQQNRSPILACWQKPFVMLDALEKVAPNELVVWFDADLQIKKKIDEIDDKSYDIGLVVRGGFKLETFKQNDFSQKFNTGTLFLYNNAKSISFLQEWISTFPKSLSHKGVRRSLWKHGDQRYLNDMFRTYYSVTAYNNIIGTQLIGAPIQYKNSTIKLFGSVKYNNYDENSMDKASIVHFKGGALRETWIKDNA